MIRGYEMAQKRGRKGHKARTFFMVCAVICAAGASAMLYMRQKVTQTYADSEESTAQSEVVETGSLSTVVSGSGTLAAVGLTDVTIPSGVEVSRIFYESGSAVSEGDLLFSVDSASVLRQMKDIQDQIDTLDASLDEASEDAVSSSLTSGVSGRVKKIYVEAEDDVSTVMYSSGSLMTLSLDGYMAVDIETNLLSEGDCVTVTTSDGTEYTGTVDSVNDGKAVILITDDGPAADDTVTVSFTTAQETETSDSESSGTETSDEQADGTKTSDDQVDGTETSDDQVDGTKTPDETKTAGQNITGTLYIHLPLGITGYAGTVYSVDVSENESVGADTSLMTLTDTSYSANYDTILAQRAELEETLNELIVLYREGGVFAPFSGKIDTISETYSDYVEEETSEGSTGEGSQTQEAQEEGSQTQEAQEASSQTAEAAAALIETEASNRTMAGDTTGSAASTNTNTSDSAAGEDASNESGDVVVLTMDPNEEMTVDVSVDETDILTMEAGQSASVTIDSIGEDVYTGTVTQINTSAESSSGVTTYIVQVTIPRTEQMLSGMSASVEIRIDGVDNALLVSSEAVHLTSSTAYVYTTYDAETQEYGGMTEVTTGLTDGSKTEITSGLKEGDTVWYEEAESSEESSFPGMGGSRDGMDMGGMSPGGNNSFPQSAGGNSGSRGENASSGRSGNSGSGSGNAPSGRSGNSGPGGG